MQRKLSIFFTNTSSVSCPVILYCARHCANTYHRRFCMNANVLYCALLNDRNHNKERNSVFGHIFGQTRLLQRLLHPANSSSSLQSLPTPIFLYRLAYKETQTTPTARRIMSRTRVAHGDARTVQRRTTSESAQTTYSPVGKAASFPHSTHNISTNTRVNEMARIGAQKTSASTFRESSQPDLSSQYQCSVCSASLDPPITRETLSELDWDRISSNLLLRHDLNFEPNIQYRPNTHGARGIERSLENVHYWDAVTVEVDTFLTRKEKMFTSRSQKCLRTPLLSSEPLRSCHSILLRLPRMFGAIRETLKTLVPDREWPAVDSRLDVDLLVQQMENRACDFISLGDCLASLLRRFCSPERDHLFDDMTAKIQLGVRQANAQLIVHGLRRAFSILEIMRLVSAHTYVFPINTD